MRQPAVRETLSQIKRRKTLCPGNRISREARRDDFDSRFVVEATDSGAFLVMCRLRDCLDSSLRARRRHCISTLAEAGGRRCFRSVRDPWRCGLGLPAFSSPTMRAAFFPPIRSLLFSRSSSRRAPNRAWRRWRGAATYLSAF